MTKDNTKISFSEYKIKATQADVASMKAHMKPKAWENIPVIGAIIYIIRMQYRIMGIDRGPLRQQIWKWNLIFVLAMLLYIHVAVMILTPWLLYAQLEVAINQTENMIKKNNL